MALQNHPDMYNAGAVVVNSQPSVNIYAQHLQRKQAREEALDNYEMNRINRMNEQGVRDIDRPGLDAKVIDMKAYYQANKDKIRRGGSPEAYNYEKMFRDTLGGVSRSKDATARSEALMKLRAERLKYGRSTPEDWFEDYRKHEETPIWEQDYSPLDLTKYSSQNAPKYDPIKTLKSFSDIKRNQRVRLEDIPGDKFSQYQYTDESFDEGGKNTIVQRAVDLYDTDDGFAAEVQQDVSNPVKRGQLEKVAMEQFGSTPQSMSDYAAAKIMQQIQPTITSKPKVIPKWKERTDYTGNWSLRKIWANKAGGGKEQVTLGDYDILGAYGDRVEERDIDFPVGSSGFKETRKLRVIPANQVSVDDKKLIGEVYPYNTNGFQYYKVRDDGNWEGARGQVIYADKVAQANLDKTTDNEVKRGRLGLKPVAKPNASAPTMVTVVLKDGRRGQIPSDKVSQFLKDNPGSKKE
jgi:hypothetical protein